MAIQELSINEVADVSGGMSLGNGLNLIAAIGGAAACCGMLPVAGFAAGVYLGAQCAIAMAG